MDNSNFDLKSEIQYIITATMQKIRSGQIPTEDELNLFVHMVRVAIELGMY